MAPVSSFCSLSKGHSSHDMDFFPAKLWKKDSTFRDIQPFVSDGPTEQGVVP